MRWEAPVIASVALAEWPDRETATVAVAIALSGTEGDDSFLYNPTVPNLPQLMGVWAIPWLPEMDPLEIDPFTLKGNAKLARMLTSIKGDDWEWSAVYLSKRWKDRMDEANQAIKKPALGQVPNSGTGIEELYGSIRGLSGLAAASTRMANEAARHMSMFQLPR